MRVIGASFAQRSERVGQDDFDRVVRDAVALLRGDGLSKDEAEAQRETLVAGYRWILVDEYQDIGMQEYELISAIAGRTINDEDERLSLFAVGDDDQNIYAFKGSSVAFIRKFEQDYKARPTHLVENYRSTAHIIRAANHIIAAAEQRMKTGHDIVVNRSRESDLEGGEFERLDPISRGRVQVLTTEASNFAQAITAVKELERLSEVVQDWDWTKAAVIAREWRFLQPVRSYCEARGIPVQMANEDPPGFWRLRETQALVEWLRGRSEPIVSSSELDGWLQEQAGGPWWQVLREAGDDFHSEFGDRETYTADVLDWLAEWGREIRKRQTGLLLLTAHRAKGLEFDHVIVLDGAWEKTSSNEDADASRRLYYVAMTRARRSLALVRMAKLHPFLNDLCDTSFITRRGSSDAGGLSDCQQFYQRLDLRDLDLSFAGRLANANPSLEAIKAIDVGDAVHIKKQGKHWMVFNSNGVAVARLSSKYWPPKDMTFVDGSVGAIVQRRKEDSAEEYRHNLKRDRWEVIVPELTFGPMDCSH
jgi:ATP-dependent DNA helicase RecQ